MQLDRTHIVIRKRMQTEIADLALVMIRCYPRALLLGFTAGALPWAIANTVLLAWIPIRESEYGFGDQDASRELFRYLSWMSLLVIAQTPIAGVGTTYFLGQAVFEKQPTWSSVWKEIRRQFGSWFWWLGMLRLPVPIMALLAVRWGQPFDPFFDVFVLLFVLAWVAFVRAGRPFVPEIILLEQCPRTSDDERVVTFAKRVRALHRPMTGELTSRMITVACGAIVMVIALNYTLGWLRGIAVGQWDSDLFSLLFLFPLSLWIVAGISVYFRLLSYLDTRIRLEGWEVELAMRAEELRQFGREDRFDTLNGQTVAEASS